MHKTEGYMEYYIARFTRFQAGTTTFQLEFFVILGLSKASRFCFETHRKAIWWNVKRKIKKIFLKKG